MVARLFAGDTARHGTVPHDLRDAQPSVDELPERCLLGFAPGVVEFGEVVTLLADDGVPRVEQQEERLDEWQFTGKVVAE